MTDQRHARRAWALLSLTALPALTVLTACGTITGAAHGTITAAGTARPAVSGPAPSSSIATPTTAAPTPTGTGAGTGTATAAGCPAGGAKLPAGAGRARAGDLDGDGRDDTVWLADSGSSRTLGVSTASGARFSTTFTSAAPQAATAYGESVTGGRIVLLDTGRSVQLYAVVGCRLVPAMNAQGRQYSFDKGFTGYGTGVGCPIISGDRHLAGYLAKAVSTGSGSTAFDVIRTTITLSGGGRSAVNGTASTIARNVAQGEKVLQIAQSVSCGSAGRAAEPQG